ncbi:MAG: hypothetical protein Q9217_005176 [Psora testacea]
MPEQPAPATEPRLPSKVSRPKLVWFASANSLAKVEGTSDRLRTAKVVSDWLLEKGPRYLLRTRVDETTEDYPTRILRRYETKSVGPEELLGTGTLEDWQNSMMEDSRAYEQVSKWNRDQWEIEKGKKVGPLQRYVEERRLEKRELEKRQVEEWQVESSFNRENGLPTNTVRKRASTAFIRESEYGRKRAREITEQKATDLGTAKSIPEIDQSPATLADRSSSKIDKGPKDIGNRGEWASKKPR